MQHQLTTIRSGKTSPGASLQNFHFPVLSQRFPVLIRALERLLLGLFFSASFFPAATFLGSFSLCGFTFGAGFVICSSWFSLTVAAATPDSLSPAFASLTSSDILFYRSQKNYFKDFEVCQRSKRNCLQTSEFMQAVSLAPLA